MLRSARHFLVHHIVVISESMGPTLLAFAHGPQAVSRVAEGDERSERALDAAEDRDTIGIGWVSRCRVDTFVAVS